ncbi:hypothetical protein RUND412_006399 [Rhizina undulata]
MLMSSLEEQANLTNIGIETNSLHSKRKAVNLDGAGLYAYGNDSGAVAISPHVQLKKLRPISCTSTSKLDGGTTRNVRSNNSALLTPEVITPFTFQQEKWLFFYITGCYPRGPATVDWNTVSADYEDKFKVGRTAKSLAHKWEEMMERE